MYEVSEPLGSNETRTCPAVLLNSSGRSLRGRRLAGLRLRRDGLRGGRTQAEEPLHRAEAVLIFSAASNGEKARFSLREHSELVGKLNLVMYSGSKSRGRVGFRVCFSGSGQVQGSTFRGHPPLGFQGF